MLCSVEIVNTLIFATACTATRGKYKSIPHFKGLWNEGNGVVARRVHSPPFQGGVAAPLIKRSRSLAAQTGWFVISNKIRIATRPYTEATRLFTNHPRPLRGLPSFERRGMNSLQQLSSISKLLASRNHQNSDVYAHYIPSFRTCRTVL